MRTRLTHVASTATAAALLAATLSAAPAHAAAAFGPVAGPGGCLAQPAADPAAAGTQDCATSQGLTGAAAVTVSPGNREVYVASGNRRDYGALEILARDPATGTLREAGCLSSDGTNGIDGSSGACAPYTGLLGADAIATSPDGATVYVASAQSGAVTAFRPDFAGNASRAGCFQEQPPLGSPCPPAHVFAGADSLAVSPDGQALFVGSGTRSALSAFTSAQITSPGGAPSPSVAAIFGAEPPDQRFANPCIAPGALDGACSNGSAMQSLSDLVINPDARHVYAAAPASGAIDTFIYDPRGNLTEVGCLKKGARPPGPCTASHLVSAPSGMAISPDGRNLYAADAGHLDVLALDEGGAAVREVGCLAGATAAGCTPVPGLDQLSAVAVSPDGSTVVTAGESGEVSTFARDPSTGALSEVGCAAPHDDRCAPAPAAGGISELAFSPDGHDVYAAATASNAVFTYAPGASPASARAASDPAGVVALRVSCPAQAAGACEGRLQLTRGGRRHAVSRLAMPAGASGASRFRLTPGRAATVTVRLSATLLTLLQRRGSLHLLALVTPDAGGGGGVGRTVVIAAPPRR